MVFPSILQKNIEPIVLSFEIEQNKCLKQYLNEYNLEEWFQQKYTFLRIVDISECP